MWLGLLGLLGGVAGFIGFSYSLADIVVSGAWRDWSLWQWVANIGQLLFCLLPFVNSIPMVGTLVAGLGGWIARLLSHLPLLGKLVTWIWSIKTALRVFWEMYLMRWFVKGGWLFNIGKAVAKLVQYCRKPWVLFGMLLLSTLSDGIFTRLFQLWGDISLRAANAAFEAVSHAMSEGGYGNPISESIAILTGAKSSLPPCFTAIWGLWGLLLVSGLLLLPCSIWPF